MGTSAMLTLIKLKRLNTRESEVLGAKKESLSMATTPMVFGSKQEMPTP